MTALQAPSVLHVTLPRASTLTDVLISPPGSPVDPGEPARARERLVIGLTTASFRSPRATALRIDSYRLQRALGGRPPAAGADGPFSPSPASCRRAIGIAAVSFCRKDRILAPAQAVAEVLARALAPQPRPGGSAWWEEWFRGLPPGARAVVRSEAVVWATQLHGALEWNRIGEGTRLGCDYRWVCPGSPQATLHAKVDVQAWVQGRPVLLVMSTGVAGPRWEPALALTALVAGLVGGPDCVPTRVVGIWPASGQTRILPIEHGTLDDASKNVIEAALAMTGASRQAG
ncbi:MAG: hypothetical protein ACLP6E_12240 [Acidimicrobiales bacterium]